MVIPKDCAKPFIIQSFNLQNYHQTFITVVFYLFHQIRHHTFHEIISALGGFPKVVGFGVGWFFFVRTK